MTDCPPVGPPSPFVARWVSRLAPTLAPGLALDIAAGRGRHAFALAAAGYRTVALDIQISGLRQAQQEARQRGLPLSFACVDLQTFPLPRSRASLIVCTRYLDRARFPSLLDALVPGGVLLYETFTEHQLRHGRGPRSPAHLLRPGELRSLVPGMQVLFDEEVWEPDAVARVAARKP